MDSDFMKVRTGAELTQWLQEKADEQKIRDLDWKQLEKAQSMEKSNLKKAIGIYESFVSRSAPYPLPYMRLSIIYRKEKRYDDEIRVLQVALSIYEQESLEKHYVEAQKRLQKAIALKAKQHV